VNKKPRECCLKLGQLGRLMGLFKLSNFIRMQTFWRCGLPRGL
jgi:hypothetical protein